jgi:SPP1 family predicted phage head-tail adaptor
MRNIGRLRHRITLQRNDPRQAVDGSQVDDWQTVAIVWGELLESRGREYLAAQEAHSELTAKIRIRYRADVKPEWRAVFQDRIFDIQQVADLAGRRRELELLVAEIR